MARCSWGRTRWRWRPSRTASPTWRRAIGRCSPIRAPTIHDETGAVVSRPVVRTSASALLIDKGNHRHFMAKEIHEQPEVVSRTLSHYVRFTDDTIQLPGEKLPFEKLSKLTISACGTAFYAALTAKYWFERFAKLPVEVDIASEFRYREVPLPKDGLALFVSQSGETADTLASLRYCKQHGQSIAAVVNVAEVDHRPRGRCRVPNPCRPRNRRGLHQGVHLPAHGSGLHGHRGGPRARRVVRGRRARAGARVDPGSAPHDGRAAPRGRVQNAGPRAVEGAAGAVSRARLRVIRWRSKAR